MQLNMMPPAELGQYSDFVSRLGGWRKSGAYYYFQCPAHNDGSPSLAVWVRDEKLVFGCHAGCAKPDILRAIGCTWSHCFPASEQKPRTREITGRYIYRNALGAVLYRKLRFAAFNDKGSPIKTFLLQRPDGNAWANGIEGITRVLYRLPDLLRADQRRTVLIVAGERDVDTAWDYKLVATTNVGGEREDWRDEYSEALSGRNVVIIPDGDEVGRKHAAEVAGSLLLHDASSLSVATLPAKDLTQFVWNLRKSGIVDTEAIRRKIISELSCATRWVHRTKNPEKVAI